MAHKLNVLSHLPKRILPGTESEVLSQLMSVISSMLKENKKYSLQQWYILNYTS